MKIKEKNRKNGVLEKTKSKSKREHEHGKLRKNCRISQKTGNISLDSISPGLVWLIRPC
jgi:hypothetical protein